MNTKAEAVETDEATPAAARSEPAEPVVESATPAYAPARKPQREPVAAAPAPAPVAAASATSAHASEFLRGTSRMQPRVEPTFGRIA